MTVPQPQTSNYACYSGIEYKLLDALTLLHFLFVLGGRVCVCVRTPHINMAKVFLRNIISY